MNADLKWKAQERQAPKSISNQLARQNLTAEQISYLRGERQKLEKKIEGGDTMSPKGKTAERLAKEYGVSPRTIYRDAKFAEVVDKLSPEKRRC